MDLHCDYTEEFLVGPEKLIEIDGIHYPAPPKCRSIKNLNDLYMNWVASLPVGLAGKILEQVANIKEQWPQLTVDNEIQLCILGLHAAFCAAYEGKKETNFGLTDFDKGKGAQIDIVLSDEFIKDVQAKYKKA